MRRLDRLVFAREWVVRGGAIDARSVPACRVRQRAPRDADGSGGRDGEPRAVSARAQGIAGSASVG